jgi:hypothetical protein
MPDAAYWRTYRAAHRERLCAQQRERRQAKPRVRGDRSAEYARRRSRACPVPDLPALFPHIRHGAVLSFWEEELRMDLEQERALATLEGRCPDAAARLYRSRETAWHHVTAPFLLDGLDDAPDD